MVPMLCATMWTRPALGRRHDGTQHAFEVIARPHRAFAVIGVVEQSRLGRPGEHHRLAAELDAIGEVRGIERRRLERLLEAVHVDQDVRSAAGLREKIADLSRHRLDLVETPIGKSGCGEGETAVVRRHQLRPRDGHRRSPLRPEPGLRAPAVHRLARGCDEQCRVGRERRSVEARARRAQAGASAERERAGQGRKAAQERAAGRECLVLLRMSNDQTEPSGTLPRSKARPLTFSES